MGKKKKQNNEWTQFYNEMTTPQNYEKPVGESGRFTKMYSYMLMHKNYIRLSNSAKTAYSYIKEFAYKSKEFRENRTFDMSITLLDKLGILTAKTCGIAFRELEHYGFIKKVNNATFQSGITQKWAFSDEWYKREFEPFKR